MLSGEEEGISDRDLLVEHLTGGEAAELRRGYGIAAERFEALLLGRDGGVKLRSRRPISPDELFERIDQMPMRQREMRERRDA